MVAGPSWLQGNPELPYVRHLAYAGSDVLISMTFLNTSQIPTQPTAISYLVTDLTNAQTMSGPNPITPTGPTQILQIPASVLVMDRTYEGRQMVQLSIAATIPDSNATSGSVTVNQLAIIELIAIATAGMINSP